MANKQLVLGKDKKVAGVCSGIAEYANLDVSVVRLIVLATTVFTGVIPGILFYVIASLIIPTEGK